MVLLLLMTVGWKFSDVLTSSEIIGQTIYVAMGYAVLTTLGTFFIIAFVFKSERVNQTSHYVGQQQSFIAPLKECAVALGMVVLGVVLSRLISLESIFDFELDMVNVFLYGLIFCIGADMAHANLNRSWRNPRVLLVPIWVVVGSLLGGFLASLLFDEALQTSLALSSGFGWFSLSSILVTSKLGVTYGAIALLTDLFRELMAICFLYLFGARFSREGVALSGAAASDSTLPIIKQMCSADMIPIALVSGIVLNFIAPPLMIFFLSL